MTNVFVDTPYYSYLYNIGATSAPDPYTQTKDTAYAFLQVVGHDAGNVVRDVPPPVTVKVVLNPGVSYTHSEGSVWDCTSSGQEVTCISNAVVKAIPDRSGLLKVYTTLAPSVLAGDTVTHEIRWAYTGLPGNPSGACTFVNQCRTVGNEIRQSRLTTTLSKDASPWQPGATNRFLRWAIGSVGYNRNNSGVTGTLFLPPDVHVRSMSPSVPTLVCNVTTEASGEVVHCTGELVNDTTDPTGGAGYVDFAIDLDESLPAPGTISVRATAGLPEQPERDWSQCVGSPLPDGCAKLDIATTVGPRLIVNKTLQPPLGIGITSVVVEATPVQTSTLTLNYRNSGGAAASTSKLFLLMPRGFEYQDANGSTPAATCAVLGSVDAGQTLTCTAAGLAVNANGTLTIHLIPRRGTQDVSTIVAGVSSDATVVATVKLDQCADEPERADCTLLDVAAQFVACDGRFGASGIFCNGYE